MDTEREFIPIFENGLEIGYEDMHRLTGIRIVDRRTQNGYIYLDIVATTIDGRTVILKYNAGLTENENGIQKAFEEATIRLNSFMWKMNGRIGVDPDEVYAYVQAGVFKQDQVQGYMSKERWDRMRRENVIGRKGI